MGVQVFTSSEEAADSKIKEDKEKMHMDRVKSPESREAQIKTTQRQTRIV